MSPRPPPTLEDSLREMFPEEWLRQTAKETGLIVRERKIDPVIIFWVLTLGFGVRLQRTLASLKRDYEKESNKTLSDSSWYYRFTPELVEFLHQCVIHGIEVRQEAVSRIADQSAFLSVWDVPTMACDLGNEMV